MQEFSRESLINFKTFTFAQNGSMHVSWHSAACELECSPIVKSCVSASCLCTPFGCMPVFVFSARGQVVKKRDHVLCKYRQESGWGLAGVKLKAQAQNIFYAMKLKWALERQSSKQACILKLAKCGGLELIKWDFSDIPNDKLLHTSSPLQSSF